MSWRRVFLADFLDGSKIEIQTGPFGTQLKASDYTPDGTPVINVRNIGYGELRPDKLEFVPDQIASRLSVHLLKKNDIVFGRKGAVDRHLLVGEAEIGWMQGSDCIRVRIATDEINPAFLSYALRMQNHRQWMITQCSNKATMASLNQDVVGRIAVNLPDPVTQGEIASILSAYDDLIENNRRRIQLLEQAARLLYKEWFVHLRFPGHEHVKIKDGVPEGWEEKPLGELAPFKYGKALKEDDRIPGLYPVYGSSGIVGTHDKALAAGPAIIVGRKGNVGSVYWSKSDFHPIDTVYYIEAERCCLYLYYALLYTQFISTDVAVPGLNRDYAHSRTLLIPYDKILTLFEQHTGVMHDQIDRLMKYNQALIKARDLLLPRLMNGELAV